MILYVKVSKKSKREEKIRNNITNVSLEDFEALIRNYGFIREGGKHPQAIIGSHVMSYKRENPVKSAYVKQLLAFIDIFTAQGLENEKRK